MKMSKKKKRRGQFPGIAGNHGSDGKFHKILNQSKRYIIKLCLRKISRYKIVRIKFSVDSGFSNKGFMIRNENTETREINR